ncbi:papilin [Biomphalaria glabrata]|nr:papilin [Biomphalaria glabrata]
MVTRSIGMEFYKDLLLSFIVVSVASQEVGWSPWSDYGACSRTCGGGVRSRTRRCLEPRSGCNGESKTYQSCETQDCPVGSLDFRSQQCSSFNREDDIYGPYYDKKSPCSLYCEDQLGKVSKLRNNVIDGTSCDNEDSFGVCVAGVCTKVGCDHVIGSTKTLDECLVCGGRGENCETLSGSSMDTTLKVGEISEIATFPFGTTKLIIRVLTRRLAMIALEAGDGTSLNLTQYLFNDKLNNTVNFSGAQGKVHQLDIGFMLTARGPFVQAVHLKIQPSVQSPDVRYEYSIPSIRIVEKNPELRYSWVDGRWSSCSVTCGVGYQRRAVNCIDRSSGQTVNNDLCLAAEMPVMNQSCSNSPCRQAVDDRFKWIPGQFTDCNTACGAGHQTQRMFCLQTNLDGASAYVPDVVCMQNIGSKPVIRRACFGSETHCGRWITSSWSQCSVSCGTGRQTRSVACERIFHNEEEVEDNDYDVSREADVEDESLCPADGRPSSQQPCNMSACSESREDEISIITVIHDCQTSRYGCCPDQITAALGENFLGCDGE